MEKLKELWAKLDPKVAMIGGVIVISTSFGTCHLMDGEEEEETTEQVAPAEPPAEAEEPAPEGEAEGKTEDA
jgi:hypothetical protein